MEMEEAFRMAQEYTRILRSRKNYLYTFGATRLPYICISPTSDDCVSVRRGEVTADRPQIALPGQSISLEGFELDDAPDWFSIMLARRISLPPSKYVHRADSVVREAGTMEDAAQRWQNKLENANDVRTGLIAAPEQVWNLSILLYASKQVERSAGPNIAEHLERMRFAQGGPQKGE